MEVLEIKCKAGKIALPKDIVKEFKKSDKDQCYLLFIKDNNSKIMRKAGLTKKEADNLVAKSNVLCVLASQENIEYLFGKAIPKFSQGNTTLTEILFRSFGTNISMSKTNVFIVPEGFKSYFSVGVFYLLLSKKPSGNVVEVWDASELGKVVGYLQNKRNIKRANKQIAPKKSVKPKQISSGGGGLTK